MAKKRVGKFEIINKLGEGSFANVYKAINTTNGEIYALKVISMQKLHNTKVESCMENEISIMSLSHQNIIKLYEHFATQRNYILVIELCSCDLSKFIQSSGYLEERIAINFLKQITDGLAFLREKNFIHRDLKPPNVLLSDFSENATIKIADFGLARSLGKNSLAVTRSGTPLYMVIFLF
jgi:serine/threonine protein kinase